MNNYTQTRSPLGELMDRNSFFGTSIAARHMAYEKEATFNSSNSTTTIASTNNLPLSTVIEEDRMSYRYEDLNYITDADTFNLKGHEEDIRLFGADAPETSSSAKVKQYLKYGNQEKASDLQDFLDSSRGRSKRKVESGFMADRATEVTEEFLKNSTSFNLLQNGTATGSDRSLADVINSEGKLLSEELIRQGLATTPLPGDAFFERDEYTDRRLEAYVEAFENKRGIFSRDKVISPEYHRYLEKIKEGETPKYRVPNINIKDRVKAYTRRNKYTKQGVTNAHYLHNLTSDQDYFTLRGSRGSSEHYQQSLYTNLMRQGGYNNLAGSTPFEGVAESLVRTNSLLKKGRYLEEGSATLFMAQQFDKGLYTSGLGEYLNANLFIPNGFGRAYKDEKGFIGSVAGFAGRMLDESYLYYTNITPDVMLIGNEYQEGQGMGPLTASKPGLFESTFTRAAEYTVAAAQSLGMYVAITQPIEMLKASIYKDALDSTLTSLVSRKGSQGNLYEKATDYLLKGFFFGFESSDPHQVLERMFEVDEYNAKVTEVNGEKIRVKQTAFFDHNDTNRSGFGVKQFVARGRAKVMLEATFKPLLKEVVNPFDVGAINPRTGDSLYKKFNSAVDELIDTISAPAGLVANFDSGARFTFVPKGEDFISSGNFRLELVGKPEKLGTVVDYADKALKDGTTVKAMTVNLSIHKDTSVGSYSELQKQYSTITTALDKRIRQKYEEVITSNTESTRKQRLAELKDLRGARDQVSARLGEAFEVMSLETRGMGVDRKKNIARKLQVVLDHIPVNPFKWGILGGNLTEKAGTLMVGQLFSFENTARMAEAAVTGDGSLNILFQQAQESKMAEFRRDEADTEKIAAFARTYNIRETIYTSMKTVDNLSNGIWTSAKDFANKFSEGSRASLIYRASKNLRRAEQRTVSKRGFWHHVSAGVFGDYTDIDRSAVSLSSDHPGKLMVKKNASHILEAISDYESELRATQGFGLDDLGRNLDQSEVRGMMRLSGEDSIQLGINKVLSGQGTNLAAEIAANNKIKGLVATLVFASIVGNSIFQSTGGASIAAEVGVALYGEDLGIAVQYEGNRFLPTEMAHSLIEKTFGSAPSLMVMNTTAEVAFIGGITYAANRLAQKQLSYQAVQYSYSLEDLSKMAANGENVRLVRKTSGLSKRTKFEAVDISDMAKAAEEIATSSANRGKLYLELIGDSKRPPIKVTANAAGNVFTTSKILQTVIKDVPVNTMIYASVALLATAGLREIAANTLQILSTPTRDNESGFMNATRGIALVGSIATGVGLTSTYLKKYVVDDIINYGDTLKEEAQIVNKSFSKAKLELEADKELVKRIKNLDPKKPLTVAQQTLRNQELEFAKDRIDSNSRIIQRKGRYESFLSTKRGKRYSFLTGDTGLAKAIRNVKPSHLTIGILAATTIVGGVAAYMQTKEADVDYSGSLDPLVAGGLGLAVGLAGTKSPAAALAIGAIAALGAYYVNWAGFKILKVGKAGNSVDEDKTRMISQYARFTSAVTNDIENQSEFSITTSGYVSQFSNLADKGLYGKDANVNDKVRVVAKQVPLPMLQFFVAEKVSGNYGEGLGASVDNTQTERRYSVGVQSGALFGMSMALELPIMYTPGRGFANFSYNPDHNLDKLPNALASMAAYSNLYLGSMATIGAVGSLLPNGVGRAFKNFGMGFGDFNRGVQSLTRNVNGFYIEQVSRTFTKLNLIDVQLLMQTAGDKIYQELELDKQKVAVTKEIDDALQTAFKNNQKTANGIKLSGNRGVIELKDANIAKLQQNIAYMDSTDADLVRETFKQVRANYYEDNNINVIQRSLIDKKIGDFDLDTLTSYKYKAVRAGGRFLRRQGISLALITIGGAVLGDLFHTAKSNSMLPESLDPDEITQSRIDKDNLDADKTKWVAGSGIAAGGLYIAAHAGRSVIREKAINWAAKNPMLKSVAKYSGTLKRRGLMAAVAIASFGYNLVKTSSDFGIARFMDKQIRYAEDGSGAIRDENGSIFYEGNARHHAAVSALLAAYTSTMFALASGPYRSMGDMSKVMMDQFEGKTSLSHKVWDTLTAGHRTAIATQQVEGVMYDISRLQFNDATEFRAHYNLDLDLENPLLKAGLQQDDTLYQLKAAIKSDIELEFKGLDKKVTNEFMDKYLGIHKRVKEKAAKEGISLVDATRYVSPDEAEEYKIFMKAVGKNIQDFGTSRPGVMLSRSKFTRNMSSKVAATLILMATVRTVFKTIDNMSQDPLGRRDKPGWLDSIYNKANAKGMWGQTKPGGGKVSFSDGAFAIFADSLRIITGRDRVDIGIIADQINQVTRTKNIVTESLNGTTKDFKSAQQLFQEVGAGFVLDDSNAYLAIGNFGGVTFRQGDHGFRTSSYFQLQSAGQDISTATYTMATKFFHGEKAGQGVELSNLIDASTRLLTSDPSSANIERTALMIRNATSMQHPLQNIRKMSKTPGSVKGDRLANLIRNAREEAGRQLNRQNVTSIYTENYYNQLDAFKNRVGAGFFKEFINRIAVGDTLGTNLLGDVLTGAYGYNPNNRNVITGTVTYSGGIAKKQKKNQGENIVLLNEGTVNLSYQNESFQQSRSGLFDYAFNSLNSMIDQGLLNFLPDFVKKTTKQALGLGVLFSLLTAFNSMATSRQFADKANNQEFTNSRYKFTAHEDTGKAINLSHDRIKQLQRDRAQMGSALYDFGEEELFSRGQSSIKMHYIEEGGQHIEDYVKAAREADPNKSFNQIMHERSEVGHSRAIITMSDMNNNVSFRFELSEAVKYTKAGTAETLDRITEVISRNQSFRIVDLADGKTADFRNTLWSRDFMELDLDTAAKGDIVKYLQDMVNRGDHVNAGYKFREIIQDRISKTYTGMIQELYGGGFEDDGSLLASSSNRYLEEVEMKMTMPDGTEKALRSQTMYEMIHGSFSDEDILSEMKRNPEIIEAMGGNRPLDPGLHEPATPPLLNEKSLRELGPVGSINDEHILTARKSLAAQRINGMKGNTARDLEIRVHKLIQDRLDEVGIQIDSKGNITTGRKFRSGKLTRQQILEQVKAITVEVVEEVEASNLMNNAARNVGMLEVETANSAGYTKRMLNRVLGRNKQMASNVGLIDDVAQFRGARAIGETGLAAALKGVPTAFETFGLFNDVVQGVDIYGAYARLAESMSDPFQTEQDVIMAKRELGKSIITGAMGVLLMGAQTKIIGGVGWVWKKTGMNATKAIAAGIVGIPIIGALGGAFYKGLIRPGLQKAGKMLNESEAVKNASENFSKVWNTVSDHAGYAAAIPVELANKWGVQTFGPETGKKVTFSAAGGVGAGVGMGGLLAGIAIGGGLFGITLTAPISIGLMAVAIGGGMIAGFVFGDGNAKASTKLLNEIPKIPVIGNLLAGLVVSPYKAIRSQERFKHHYRNSPFTAGYAGDIVNQKWMSMLAAADDPTGSELVSNMFGEIIRTTEYETSAWKAVATEYGSNPIPIVDGVIERELKLRSTYYSDLVIGRYTWGQILKNSDQNEAIKAQIKDAKSAEAAILQQKKANALKGAQTGGSSVPSSSAVVSQNNHAKNAEIASAIAVIEASKNYQKQKETSVVYEATSSYSNINNALNEFSKINKDLALNGGVPIAQIPMQGIEVIKGHIELDEGVVKIGMTRGDDPYMDVVRKNTLATVTENRNPDPSEISQGRAQVMNALVG